MDLSKGKRPQGGNMAYFGIHDRIENLFNDLEDVICDEFENYGESPTVDQLFMRLLKLNANVYTRNNHGTTEADAISFIKNGEFIAMVEDYTELY